MLDTEKRSFLESLYGMSELYQTTLTETQLRWYWMALRDLPLRDVKAGMAACVREIEFWPKPAEIRRLAYSGSQDRDDMPVPDRPSLVGAVDATTTKDQAKVNLAKIQNMLYEISCKVALAKPDNSEEVAHYAAIGREVMDPKTLDRAYRDALKPKTKRGRR